MVYRPEQASADSSVSLFTREWIEIATDGFVTCQKCVSLFTREWIEIHNLYYTQNAFIWSPSLRGSGLKCLLLDSPNLYNRLPLYEGVD